MNIQDKFRDPKQRPAAPPPGTRPPARRFLRPRALIALGLGIAVLAGAVYYYWGTGGDAAGKPILATATRGDVEDVVTAVGNLQPLTSVDVGAQVSGQLQKLAVKIGDEVMKGQLLAEIDPAVAQAKVDAGTAQLQNFQAQLLQKQSDLALAQAQADRQTRLMQEMATSQDAYDVAQAALKSGQAQVRSVQAQIAQQQSTLKADQATLGYSKIYAPMSGTVTAIPAKEGQTLNANQIAPLILTVADLSTMQVSTQVSEADVPKLTIGMDAYFTTLGDPNKRWSGQLRQILPTPTVVNNVVLYTALFNVANPDKVLMPLMTAQVFFVRGAAHDAVLIPVAALRYQNGGGQGGGAGRAGRGQGGDGGAARRQGGNGGGNFGRGRGQEQAAAAGQAGPARERRATVIVVKDDGSQETRDVTVGVSDRVNAAILSGLSEGEKVIAGTESGTQARAARAAGRPAGGGGGGFGGPPGGGGFGGFR